MKMNDYKIDQYVENTGPTQIQNWINAYEPLLQFSSKSQLAGLTRFIRPITDYFCPATGRNPNNYQNRRQTRQLQATHLLARANRARPKQKVKKPPDPRQALRAPILPPFFRTFSHRHDPDPIS